ncbi:hypothetical protein K2X40_04520 [Candidatus Babeliales bacterium]|nr:hypothetical protein [Candidatus Babeliales bacterium]MBY0354017.1 hypothetical protein [Candidatus Babeliales bacterium]
MIKAYVVPFLYEQLRSLRKRETELLEKEKLIMSTMNRVERTISHQKKMFVLLERKVKTWYDSEQERKEVLDKEHEKIREQITEKRKIQATFLTLAKEMQQAIPEAVDLARKELVQKYAHDKGKNVLKQCIEQFGSVKTTL